jgi:hypothetical protein
MSTGSIEDFEAWPLRFDTNYDAQRNLDVPERKRGGALFAQTFFQCRTHCRHQILLAARSRRTQVQLMKGWLADAVAELRALPATELPYVLLRAFPVP